MIKFRAWDKVQNKMLLPDNIEFIYGQAYWAEASTDGQDECSNDGKVDGISALFELEQFTGLTDVNGKEIYIGDIVKYRNLDEKYQYLKIRWLQQDCMIDAGGYRIDIVARRCEVIGNVHENAELLKG